MAPLNILIVGCSVAGPTLATFLLLSPLPANEKPHITILERSPTMRTDGQNIDIRGSGVTIIRKLGLEAAIRASTTGEVGVQFVDGYNTVWAQLAADTSGKYQTPTSDIEILRGRLADLLWRRSQAVSEDVRRQGGKGIEYIFGDYLSEIKQNGERVDVCFAKKQDQKYGMGLGGSEGDMVKRLGMYAAFFSMPRGKTDSQWRRWFHASGRRGIMVRPGEQHDKTTVFMYVINDKDERLPAVATKGREDLQSQKALMMEYFHDAGWESERIIKEMMETRDFYYDLVGQVKMDKWSKGRVVLLGDSGYCASPVSGMGTTLALNGAYNLAGSIVRNPRDPAATFAQYEETMRPLVNRAQRLAPGMPHLMNPETAWGVTVLNWIMYFLSLTRLQILLFMLGAGPPANVVSVEDYGFEELKEIIE